MSLSAADVRPPAPKLQFPKILTLLPPATRTKLVGCFERAYRAELAGEQVVAIQGARRLLRSLGLEWTDVLRPAVGEEAPRPPSITGWRADLAMCCRYPYLLTDWEQKFTASLARRTPITPRRREFLRAIVSKIRDTGSSV